MEGNKFEVGFINIVASPHPLGIYPQSMADVSGEPIQYYGNNWAAILAPNKSKVDDKLYEGILTVWTDVDSSEPSIDKNTLTKQDVEGSLKKIFDERGFNNRSFNYILDDATHKIAMELKNDHGKTISIKQVEKIFNVAFSRLNREGQTYEVTVVPEDDALDLVLGLKRLDKVRMVIKRPNPGDHLDTDAADVLREMEEQNINKDERTFTRQSGTDTIHLNDANLARAAVAATDGFVESGGRDENGMPEKRSTKEYPKIVRATLEAGTSFISALRNEARRFRGG
jgi:Domain of unknown function (DUF4747)